MELVRNKMSRKTTFGSRVLSSDVAFFVPVMNTNFYGEVNSSQGAHSRNKGHLTKFRHYFWSEDIA